MIRRQFLTRPFGVFVIWVCFCAVALAAGTQFDFDGGDLSATLGPGTLAYLNGATTSAQVSFGTASSLGLPALPGGDARVMSFAAFAPDQGFQLVPACPPNGGGGDINQYTMIWDLLVADMGPAGDYMSLMNTNPANSNDGDFFIKSAGATAGIGISGQYHGAMDPTQWHRIAVSVDLTTSTMNKYIDGSLVGSQTLSSGVGGRWSLYADGTPTLLLADEDGETKAGYLNSFYFVDQALDANAIGALGGPDANGIVPEPSTLLLLALGAVLLLACKLRGRRAVS